MSAEQAMTANEATETAQAAPQASAFPESDKKTVQLVYILQCIGFIFGITFIAGVIVNYIKRGDMQSDLGKSHMSYQIRTFWWSALWTFLSMLLTFVVVGYVTLLVAYIWTIYRVVKGFMRLSDGKPV